MIGLDVLYWACLFLGASYIVLTMALGGVSHIASQMHLGGDIGDVGDAGTVGDAGDFGHVDAGDFGHADAGGDFGHADAGHGAVGHADGGNAGGSADAGGLAHDGAHRGGHSLNLLAFLNPMLATGFLFGFGGVGVLARAAQLMPLPSLGWAAAGGGSLYYLTFWIIHRVFGAAQGSSHTRREDFVGHSGLVMAPICGSKPGMVYYTVGGSRQSVRAITEDGQTIPVGATVLIRRVVGKTAVVARMGDDVPPRAYSKGAADD